MTAQAHYPFWTRGRLVGAAVVTAVIGVFAIANAHLVAVSFSSQPDCIPHLKSPTEDAGAYRAAKPSC